MGKSIDKRMDELGGQRFLKLHCADEGTGNMEEIIELWKSDCLIALQKALHDAKTKVEGANASSAESTVFTGTTSQDVAGNSSNETLESNETKKAVGLQQETEWLANYSVVEIPFSGPREAASAAALASASLT